MIGDALGFEEADHPTLLKWSDDLMRLGQDDPDKLAAMMAAFEGYTTYMADVIADRRAHPADDLTSILVHAEVDGESFDDATLVHETLLILIGGDETTRHVITGGLYQLLSDRRHWDALLADRRRCRAASRRCCAGSRRSRTWRGPRRVTWSCVLAGSARARRSCCCTRPPTVTRSSSPIPSRSTSARAPNEHVAFGFGTHFASGTAGAPRAAGVVRAVARAAPGIRLVDRDEPDYRPANFVSGYETMKVAW